MNDNNMNKLLNVIKALMYVEKTLKKTENCVEKSMINHKM